MSKTTVIHHSADFDGLFCREIAKKFLGTTDVEYIGWDFKDAPLAVPEGQIYILDLPVDRVFGFTFGEQVSKGFITDLNRVIWIDHHKSSIASHPANIPGYRIDGVAACRLAFAYFTQPDCTICKGNGFVDVEKNDRVEQDDCGFCANTGKERLPSKQDFLDRKVSEPLAVLLAGEYDVWDSRPCDTLIGL